MVLEIKHPRKSLSAQPTAPNSRLNHSIFIAEHLKTLPQAKSMRFSDNEVIYLTKSNACTLFIIDAGIAKIHAHLSDGKTRIVRLVTPGNFIGLEGLITTHHRHSASALGPVKATTIPINRLKSFEETDPKTYGQLLKHFYFHLELADTWILDFSTGCIKARVARMIDFLSQIEYGENSDFVELIKVQDIAEILGSTPETVSRIIADLKRNHVLDRVDNHLSGLYKVDVTKLNEQT